MAVTTNDCIINTTYMSVLSVELMLRDVERRLAKEGAAIKQDKKQKYRFFCDHCKKALYFAEQLTQDIYDVDAEKNWKNIPVWQEESNELARLILLYADKSADVENVFQIFKLLRSLKGEGLITEEDLEPYYLQKL